MLRSSAHLFPCGPRQWQWQSAAQCKSEMKRGSKCKRQFSAAPNRKNPFDIIGCIALHCIALHWRHKKHKNASYPAGQGHHEDRRTSHLRSQPTIQSEKYIKYMRCGNGNRTSKRHQAIDPLRSIFSPTFLFARFISVEFLDLSLFLSFPSLPFPLLYLTLLDFP
jgi:hypothetical protein